ncbi:hypothetical protein OPQ81_009489 [Rhizoctonia solani]|nr:hypothetical protein OPQ81_009489 [Rhizoctonia solani]
MINEAQYEGSSRRQSGDLHCVLGVPSTTETAVATVRKDSGYKRIRIPVGACLLSKVLVDLAASSVHTKQAH